MGKHFISYNQIHKSLLSKVDSIQKEAQPQVIVAIGGGGYIPARIIRTWIKIPIVGVCIQLYTEEDTIHENGPQKFQWLDQCAAKQVKGKRVLLVDEVDDTRTTLHYCVKELLEAGCAEISVLVIHNKLKDKAPLKGIKNYFACHEVEGERWIVYPWEAEDIDEHDKHIEK